MTELIPMVEMETRNPVVGYFLNEFQAICNHCGVMAAWSRKRLNIFEKFCVFFWKNDPYGKIFNFMFLTFSSWQGLTYCVQILLNLANKKLVKLRTAYLTKKNKILPGFPAVGTAWIVLKICQGQTSTMNSRVLQISSKSVHFRWNYSQTHEHPRTHRKVNPIFDRSLASSLIKMHVSILHYNSQ